MAFRGDDQRRYGQVPPVQYPVSNQYSAQQQQQAAAGRRLSYMDGDDGASYHDPTSPQQHYPQNTNQDELFMSSPAQPAGFQHHQQQQQPQHHNSMAGYHHRYQDPAQPTHANASYNPQSFAPPPNSGLSGGVGLPYTPHPAAGRYAHSNAQGAPDTAPQSTYNPQSYNPAAYTSPVIPQRQPSYGGYDQGYGAQAASPYGPSPTTTYAPSFAQPLHSPGLSAGYQQSLNSPTSIPSSTSQLPTPTYDPSQYATGQYQGYPNGNGAHPAPYPPASHIPVGPEYESNDHSPHYQQPSRSGSHASSAASHYSQTPASPGLQRHPTNAPLPSRPLDGANQQRWNDNDAYEADEYSSDNANFQDSIIQDIEAELNVGNAHPRRPLPANSAIAHEQASHLQRYASDATTLDRSPRQGSPRYGQGSYDHGDDHGDDDEDPEATAGILAMQQAELDDARFSGSTFAYVDMPAMPAVQIPNKDLPPPPEEQTINSDSSSDFGGAGMDLSGFGGGHVGTYSNFGAPPGSSSSQFDSAQMPTPRYFNNLRQDYRQAAAYDHVEVDYGGTGGLQPPTASRLSFDEGDENVSIHSQNSGIESPNKDDLPEFFYHPGPTNRPLPAIPPGPGSDSSSMLSAQNSVRQPQHAHSGSADFRMAHDPRDMAYNANHQLLQPERSVSVSDHSTTPQVVAPARSRTDADQERKKITRHQMTPSQSGTIYSDYESTAVPAAGFDNITLPTRKRKFIPGKLTKADFVRCSEPWALSSVEAWLREMTQGEPYLREKTVEETLTSLFTDKVATMNVADAEVLSSSVFASMLKAGVLLPDEEWVKFGEGHISGVLWHLTGSGCYSPKLHEYKTTGRCYSFHCTRTSKKADLEDVFQEEAKDAAWNVFYGLKPDDWAHKSNKEVERQNILHEIVTGEEGYIRQLEVFRTLWRDDLRNRNPPIIHPDKRDRFLATVFGKVDTVVQINKDYLLAQLKYRQQEQGPWISGFSDLFREWIRKAKNIYIEYATAYPRAEYMMRKEGRRNLLFKKFLDEMQKHKASMKKDWTHFLIAPLTRLQRYILLLESAEKKMTSENEEKTNLAKAIQEIKVVTLECDAKVAETNKRVEMMELDRKLVLRPGFQSVLNLDHLGRALIMQGDLQRLGNKGMRWVDTHALLFDHYLILAKIVLNKDGRGEDKYDVSREPIPMPLLFLESMNDEPIVKQKGITAPLTRTAPATASGAQLSKVSSNGGRPTLEHTNTSSSFNTLSPAPSNDPDSKILYPFRIKHLGHDVYTLYAPSAQDRLAWCTKIVEAKTMHAKALFSQNAEPFRLRVLADASFHYDASSVHAKITSVPVRGTPLDRAIQELEAVLGPAQGTGPVSRTQVNCAAGFSAFGKSFIAIGTEYGVFISDPTNPRGWTKSVTAARVSQMAILEEFNVCLLISDKSLISYPLDVIAPVSDFAPPGSDSARRAPQRLAKDVSYFATAKMKDRTLVFYKRKEGLHTSFKVLEPLYHKASEKKTRLFGGRKSAGGSTDTFRDFDEFFFPTECFSLSVFQTYIAVATAKGIEMLTLDKKQPMSIPDLKAPAIANIASRIRDQRPLGMFRLNENEFLCTYEDCAVYVDKHGDVSRTLIMEYTGKQKKARGATMYGQYLLLFNEDYVEVRNAENGRLRQIIAGRDVRVIDYGIRGPTGGNAMQTTLGHHGGTAGDTSKGTVKIAMAHPEISGRQIILEMLLNDGHAEGK
ncbi:Putative Rho1 guanine nucleotide exchange factor 3 [[Torrubiella] hemipterigena]|uniref:Putative Rho1 guanine nucleotide exchange factor 3 n=1 Tax=[Torrubiella] hemipterigena TaxID=1531966 RepID=A0A0A1TDK0_9HYPO|nr:Putative Rho1 guanine nucleotide exchange factor 3 [[Torrubiella] hemipterigena]